jgi:choline dehydrogenase-like flavoprotein
MGTATMMPSWGAQHRDMMTRYAHMGVLTAMLHETSAGRVEPDGDMGLSIDYWPNAPDRRDLVFGLKACARLLFAAGARRVWIPSDPPLVLADTNAVARLANFPLLPQSMQLTAVHPMGSVPMGDDPKRAAVNSRGAHHHMHGLWVADGSLFPSSIGVPPQLSIYAMGLHVGRHLVAAG